MWWKNIGSVGRKVGNEAAALASKLLNQTASPALHEPAQPGSEGSLLTWSTVSTALLVAGIATFVIVEYLSLRDAPLPASSSPGKPPPSTEPAVSLAALPAGSDANSDGTGQSKGAPAMSATQAMGTFVDAAPMARTMANPMESSFIDVSTAHLEAHRGDGDFELVGSPAWHERQFT